MKLQWDVRDEFKSENGMAQYMAKKGSFCACNTDDRCKYERDVEYSGPL